MKYDEYLAACLKFAKDTRHWSYLPSGHFFTTNGDGEYEESSDNANGGIDVKWAFKMTAEQVRKYAPQSFMDCCTDFLQLAVDDPEAANDFVAMAYDLFT